MTTPQQPEQEIWQEFIPARRDWAVTRSDYVSFDATDLGNSSPIPPTVDDVQQALEVLSRYVSTINMNVDRDIGLTPHQALALIASWARATATRDDLLAAIDFAVGSAVWRQGAAGVPIAPLPGTAQLLATGTDSEQRTWTARMLSNLIAGGVGAGEVDTAELADGAITGNRVIDATSVDLAKVIVDLLSLSSLPIGDRLPYSSLIDTPTIPVTWNPSYDTGISYSRDMSNGVRYLPMDEVEIPAVYLPSIQGGHSRLRINTQYASTPAGLLTLEFQYKDNGVLLPVGSGGVTEQIVTPAIANGDHYADFPTRIAAASPDEISLHAISSNVPVNLTDLRVFIEWRTLNAAAVRNMISPWARQGAQGSALVAAIDAAVGNSDWRS